ncbi:MAG: hypothetical protein JRI36_06465, partial [Deltaproteobacteria bacterium]|nr:hypothetical protein [Deltaproteobacteria bacterium]
MIFRYKIFSVVVGIALVISGHAFFKAHRTHALLKLRLKGLKAEVNALETHRKQSALNRRRIDVAKDFVDRARSLGLTRTQWHSYRVTIAEPVSFQEAEYILNQTANSPFYYFRPVQLHIKEKTASESNNTATGRRASAPQEQGDLLLTL